MDDQMIKPSVLAGFTHFHHWWDNQWGRYTVKIAPGELYVANDDIVLTTVLGSCVSACLYDPIAGVGAMNHFMLPDGGNHNDQVSRLARFGSYAMDQLLNEMLKVGCRKEDIQVKVTGGGNIIGGAANIGIKNTQFVIDYLRDDGLNILSADLGGSRARKVVFIPKEGGRLLVRKLDKQENNVLIDEEKRYQDTVEHTLDDSDVELF